MNSTKTFQCKTNCIQITVPVLENGAVITAKHRNYHPTFFLADNPFRYGAPLQVLQEEQEFWNDIQNQISYLHNTPSNITTLDDHINACINAVYQHIEKHNRLIDSDMEMYIDCAMHIMSASNANAGVDMITLRKGIIGAIIEQYGSYIYFTRNSAFGQPELVKLMQ